MIRWTLLLCAGLYAALWFGGADRGQQRFGLIGAPVVVAAPVATPVQKIVEGAPPPKTGLLAPAAFVPAQPVMTPQPPLKAGATAETAPEFAPQTPAAGQLMVVNANSANVRGGPGTDYSVMGRLTRGEAVLVVAEANPVAGWSLIRIEGDGIEGYIASRLLTP